jgi:multidrug efflux system outer membrane protein
VAQVVAGRIRVATQQRLLATAVNNIKSRENTLKVVERRYNNGLTSPLDVYLARENLAAAQAAEPFVRQSLILAQHSLDVLCGRLAGAEGVLPEVLPDMQPPGPVPAGLPAALLDRRPDVRAAEMQLVASTELIGASIAAMFPDFTLTATGGYSSDSYRMLSATENQVYSFLMNLAAPIYKGGSLKARVEAAEARRDQAISNYGQVILTAFREVEDALVRQRELYTQTELLKVRHTEALRGEKLAQDRYSKGLESVLVILDTERRRRRAEDELTVTMGRLYDARVALFLAIGGDWQINTNETGVNDG